MIVKLRKIEKINLMENRLKKINLMKNKKEQKQTNKVSEGVST